MKILQYAEMQPTHFESDQVKGIAARVVIGKNDGANNFCMRIFEIGAVGHTPMHSHDWEHEMFIHSGSGELYGNGQWNPVKSGNVASYPATKNTNLSPAEPLTFLCLVPSHAPEFKT
jgi:quercetin dioxygenase-like cupin family protein